MPKAKPQKKSTKSTNKKSQQKESKEIKPDSYNYQDLSQFVKYESSQFTAKVCK